MAYALVRAASRLIATHGGTTSAGMSPGTARRSARATLAVLALLLAAGAARAGERSRVWIIDLDGVRRDTFERTYASGALPAFASILDSALWFDAAMSVLPTVTMAAQSAIFTGAPPERHGIPGNEWFDRAAARTYTYTGTSTAPCLYAITLFGGAECRDGLLNRHLLAPTLYEAAAGAGLSSMVVYHPVFRGATRPVLPSISDALNFLQGSSIDFEGFDRKMAERAVQSIAGDGLPDILTVYFAGADELAHGAGIAAQPGYLANVIDPLVGRIAAAIEARDPEWRSSTMIVVTADHGRTDAVANPEDRTLERDLGAAVARAGFLAGQFRLAVNGGMAYVYLKNGETWSELPTAEQTAAAWKAIVEDPVISRVLAEARLRRDSESPRFGDITVFLTPGHYFGNTGTGSHHGNADALDLAVPLVVARPGWPAGHTNIEAGITRVAAGAAEFLGFAIDGADRALSPPSP